LDKLAAGQRYVDLEAEYNVAKCLEKAPEFFEKAVLAWIERTRGCEAWSEIDSQWDKLGFSGGRSGGIALMWNRIEAEAEKRMAK